MAASRSTTLRALRTLSLQRSAPLRRSLHMTGPQSAQPINADKATLYATRTLADLKTECQQRHLGTAGSKDELVDRLTTHDSLQSRAFSIALKRINGTFGGSRQFNTSRASKAVHDSSTVDFAFMPSMAEIDAAPALPGPRMPTFPDNFTHHLEPQGYTSPLKPQVYALGDLSPDLSVSAISEVVGNQSAGIGHRQKGQSEETGVLRDLWSGILEDILGPKQTSQRK